MTVQEELLTAAEGAALIGAPQTLGSRPARARHTPWASTDERQRAVAERFRRDVAQHEMTVCHEDGVYRHLRFMAPQSSEFWFDIVTWPGTLAIRGDIDGYMFSRTRDMFEFFRADRRRGINAHYWAEKSEGGRRSVQVYSEDLFRQLVVEHFVDAARWGGVPTGTGKALRTWVLDEDLSDEHHARNVLEDFAHQGFEFSDVWEWDFHDYTPMFLWACHAIAWGIAQYDAAKAAEPGRVTAIRRVRDKGRWRVKWRLDGARRVRSFKTATDASDYMRYLAAQCAATGGGDRG